MCQLWALHAVIKRQFFTFIFAVFLLNLFYRCILLHKHKPIYGVVVLLKRTEDILEYYLQFQFGNRLSSTRHSLMQSNYFCLLVPFHWRTASEFLKFSLYNILHNHTAIRGLEI